jgi:hypothetical protein
MTFWRGSGSADPHPDPDLYPTPDLTSVFSDSKEAKKNSHFFLITYPQAYYLLS